MYYAEYFLQKASIIMNVVFISSPRQVYFRKRNEYKWVIESHL